MERSERAITLPVAIVSPTDIARLTREIEAVDNFFREQEIRAAGQPNAMPRLSKLMDMLVSENQMNLLELNDRSKLLTILQGLHKVAPVMHISFSVDPPGAYVQKLVAWLRKNIHAYVLVTVGLQPNIGAGCIVRTTNKLFDFSLREYFTQKREFFIDKLHTSVFEDQSSNADKPQVTVSNNNSTVPTTTVAVPTTQPLQSNTATTVVAAPQAQKIVVSEGTSS
ncbi:MAG: hypothetical protein Q7T41_04045 [Candidatus Saccharibacteria bacterium]|nr:hypothetical protein [Candidatus Saccharibacteria bacterium]